MVAVILDTNIFISGLIAPFGLSALCLQLALAEKLQPVISLELLLEYRTVAARPRFRRYFTLEQSELLMRRVQQISISFDPQIKLHAALDAKDDFLLELAHVSNANFLITGNTADFPFSAYRQTQIVTPRGFLESYLT